MPNFFIPETKDEKQRDRVLQSIIDFINKESGSKIDNQRIYKLDFNHDGENFVAEVGEKFSYNNEVVIAILHDQIRDLHYVCTPSRGVTGGSPIMVGKFDVNSKILFKDSPSK